MDQRRPAVPEYTLDLFADPACVKDIVKGKHTEYSYRPSLCAPNPLTVLRTLMRISIFPADTS